MYNLSGGEKNLLQFFFPTALTSELLKGPGNDFTVFINTSCSSSSHPLPVFSTKDCAFIFKSKVQKLLGDL